MKNQILQGDALTMLKTVAVESVNCTVTSPPYYGLRNYGLAPTNWPEVTYIPMSGLPPITIPAMSCCLGLESSLEAYVGHMVLAFRELWRVLRADGVTWLNLGDSYSSASSGQNGTGKTTMTGGADTGSNELGRYIKQCSLQSKNLIGIPWRVVLALQADGWYLRSECIWAKTNPLPESCKDRFTKSHEYVFMLTKSAKYWFDQDAVREPLAEVSYDRMDRKQSLIERFGAGTLGKQVEEGKVNQNHSCAGLAMGRNGKTGYNPQGRNRRTVQTIPTDQDPLLSYIINKLATDDPERLAVIFADYERDDANKTDMLTVSTRPYKEAHFATFPAALIEPLILAGCPSRVCVECGEPWVRVVETVKKSMPVSERHGRTAHNGQPPQISGNFWDGPTTKATSQHQPVCTCDALHQPGIVLDPFFGSGTVGVVARQCKRDWLGIELNPDYISLARKRIDETQPALFAR